MNPLKKASPKTDWEPCNISPSNLEEIEKQIKEHYKANKTETETKLTNPFINNHHMLKFCKETCPFTKENCQHSCSLIVYEMKHCLRKVLGIRPNCPKCGAADPKSAGHEWRCIDCGKYWGKHPQPKKHIERSETPCPECKSKHIHSNGVTWNCANCGKSWLKNKRSFSINDFPELTNRIVVREVKTF